MEKVKLREFEALVLLSVASLQAKAYGVEIKRKLETQLNEKLSIGFMQSSLKRMEEKGFLTSEFGEATMKRGGKRKRIYSTTSYGHKILGQTKNIRDGLWNSMSQSSSHELRISI
jgi:DNA-binding PadR family transcriptional regulator